MLEILLALLAALLFAFGTVFQQRGAMEEPDDDALKASFLLKLVRKPVWLLGVAGDGLGYAAQAAALGVGRLVIVQPLLVASVVFALPLGVRFTGQRIGRREIAGAVAVTAGLAVFTAISDPDGGVDDARDRGWIVSGAIVGVATLVLVLIGLGRRPALKAALLGTGAGVQFGYVSALTKATVDRFDDGFVAVVADWHVYGLVAAALIGFLLVQASLQTGALAPSIATTMSLETIVGIALGLTILDEELHDSTVQIAISALSLLVALGGLIALAGYEERTEAPASAPGRAPAV